MARIRTVKPELFRHEELYQLEIETGLPIRLAWIGLFTIADREGRFKWRAREIKLDIMPYDSDIDFEHILEALEASAMISKYSSGGDDFGVITSFKKHQVINARESQSRLPIPPESVFAEPAKRSKPIPAHVKRLVLACACTCVSCGSHENLSVDRISPFTSEIHMMCDNCNSTHISRVTDLHVHAHGEGKGREGNWKGREKEKEGKGSSQTAANKEIWEAYRSAYLTKYKVEPVRNASVNSKISQLAKRLGAEAVSVVEFYVRHPKSFYVEKMHDIGLCLSDAEALRTQWAKGRAITRTDIKNYEANQHFTSQLERIEAGEI